MSGQALSVTVYPAARSEASLYEDDGESLGYRRGAFARRRFSERREGSPVRVEASAIEGSWRPAPRDLVLRIRADSEPTRVLLDRTALSRQGPTAPSGEAGWRLTEDGFVEVRLRDRAEGFAIVLEGAP